MKLLYFFIVLGVMLSCVPHSAFAQGQPFVQRGSFPDANVQSQAFTSSISIVPTGSPVLAADRVAVGAADDFAPKPDGLPGLGVRSGTVYVYDAFSTSLWIDHETIYPLDATNNEKFGHSVSFIDEDTIAIGAPHYDQVGKPNCGAVYIFERTPSGNNTDSYEWVQSQLISPDSLQAGDKFGYSVSAPKVVSSDPFAFVVGAPYADHAGKTDCGRAFVYFFDAVAVTAPFVHAYSEYCPNPRDNNHFGRNVSCNPDAHDNFSWVAGAPNQYVGPSRNGAAYYYRTIFLDTDSASLNKAKFHRQEIIDLCGEGYAGFGWSVALSVPYKLVLDPDAANGLKQIGQHLVVGAPFDDEYGIDDGSASVFIPEFKDRANPYAYLQQIDKLRSQVPDDDGHFGYSVEVGLLGVPYLSHTDYHSVFVGTPGAGNGVVEYFPPHVDLANSYYDPRGADFCLETVIWYNDSGTPLIFTGDQTIPGDKFGWDLSISLGDNEIGVISSTRRSNITNGNTYYFVREGGIELP